MLGAEVAANAIQSSAPPRPPVRVTVTFDPAAAVVVFTDSDGAGAIVNVSEPDVPPPGGGTSGSLTFTIAPAPVLSVSTTTVAPGASVTVTLTGGLGGALDWIAFAPTAAPNTSYLTYTFVGAGVTTRTWTVTAPSTPGTYEFRLFPNNGFTRAATSATVTVR